MPDDKEPAAVTAVAADTDKMGDDDMRAQQAVSVQETQDAAADASPEGEKGDGSPSETPTAQETPQADPSRAAGPSGVAEAAKPEAEEEPPQVRGKEKFEYPPSKAPASHGRVTAPVAVPVSVVLVLILALGVMLFIISRQQASQKAFLNEFQHSMSQVAANLSNVQPETGPASLGGASTPETLDDYSRLTKVGSTLFRSGQYEEAAKSYRAALKLYPTGNFSDEAHYHLGLCLLKGAEPDEAAKEFRAVVTHTPGSRYYARSAVEMSELLIQKKNFVQARRLLYMVLGSRDRLDADEREALERTYYAIARCFEGEAETIEAMYAGSVTSLSAFLMDTPEPGNRLESASETPTRPTESRAQLDSRAGDAE